jgi:branched-chain amino acid transport system substrate-binding protein
MPPVSATRRDRSGRRWLLVSGGAALAAACGVIRRSPASDSPPADGRRRGPTAPEPEHTVVRPIPAEVRLGATLPLSGPHAEVGLALQTAYQLAADEANGAGGVPLAEYGRAVPVRLVLYDDQGHGSMSRQLAERLVDYDRVDALLGGYGGSAAGRMAVAESRAIPYVTATDGDAELFRGRRYGFGFVPPVSRLGAAQLAWLAWCQDRDQLRRPTRVALLSESGPSGEEYRAAVQQGAADDPSRFGTVLEQAVPPAATDHRSLARAIRDAEADVLLGDLGLEDTILLQRQLTALRAVPRVVSYGFSGHQVAARAQLGSAGDRMVAAAVWSPALAAEESRAFAARFSAAFGRPPSAEHALGYSAATLLLRAISRAGTHGATRVRDSLLGERDSGVLPGGAASFERGGLAHPPLLLVQNLPNGQQAVVWPVDLRTAEPSIEAGRP